MFQMFLSLSACEDIINTAAVLSLLLDLCMAHVVKKRYTSSLLHADLSGCALMQGTFLIRPSISLTGCMVVSTVAENGSVKHLCLDSKQLYSRALEVSLAAPVQSLSCA